MAKPIGNQTINLKSGDKVAHKTQARYGSRAAFHVDKDSATPVTPEKKVPKYKTRKK